MQGVRKKFTNKAASTVTAYFLLLSSLRMGEILGLTWKMFILRTKI